MVFDGFGGVDQAAELGRVFEKCGESVPMTAPAVDGYGISGAQRLGKALLRQLGRFDGVGAV